MTPLQLTLKNEPGRALMQQKERLDHTRRHCPEQEG